MFPSGLIFLVLLACCSRLIQSSEDDFDYPPHIHCRDPDLGGELPIAERRFLLLGGEGSGLSCRVLCHSIHLINFIYINLLGIGNFFVFFPAAYYFAALTGRDILIYDHSLIGEVCNIIQCGFPKVNDIARIYPGIFTEHALKYETANAKPFNFGEHIDGRTNINQRLVNGWGYRSFSGWYLGRNFTEHCVNKLTGCHSEDTGCHDRHAMQRLIRGNSSALT